MQGFMAAMADPAAWAALVSLIAMEIVLGIDNLVFLALLTNQLPEHQRPMARKLGLGLALIIRLLGLAGVAWVVSLTQPLFTLFGHDFSVRDLILIAGGLFLIWKATSEIMQMLNPEPEEDSIARRGTSSLMIVVFQIPMFDIVFSVDSIITAVGMTDHLPVMMIAVVVAILVMLFASGPLAKFLQDYPSLTVLALGFLLLIGATLVADGFGTHFPRGYIYTAMAFSAVIVALDLLSRRAARLRRIKGRHKK
ncbi:Integral membrane protein TerC [Ketogulonicigenium robustum]|uniref:Integral membrane protein TerC n=1 Tax=Ketogulonicigenium robustum TaxID=92947 RepID=A0A1W6NVW7_9RHOB|nr:TerC family protein [Ketogulonicigenium robustum]ARO13364.1 Integral membrane protein TerC [Ketogulonicigenium robustum]